MIRLIVVGLLIVSGCSPALQIKKQVLKSEESLHDHIGFYVTLLHSDKPLININGAKYFIPASNTKIVTLYTSARLLGDSVSALKYTQRNDSLFFQGMGDPSFLYSAAFNNNRAYYFLKNFPGKLFFNASNFDTEPLGPGWAWDDYNDDYSAERSSLPVYGNLISIKKKPGNVFDFQPKRFASDFQLSSESHDKEEIIRSVDSNQLIHYDSKKKNNSWSIPFRSSRDLTADLLSDTLHRSVEEIDFFPAGKYNVLKSVPVDSVYKVMMVESDNFIAEQLLLQCALTLSDTLNPEIAIRYAVKNFLTDLPDQLQWVDGSGLSRFNLFTPRSIVALWKKLMTVVPQERLFQLLPVGGKRGTLKNGYKAEVPYLYGKTGSLSNNHCVSGFLITKKKRVLVFSLMHNNFIVPGNAVRKQMQVILEKMRDRY